jgi:O-antigen/teichoic acid export membrane protein
MAKRSFLRDTLGVFTSNIASIIFGVLVVILLTNILGSEGFGLYYALIVIPLIVLSISHLGIRGASIFLIGQKRYSENDLVSAVISILLVTGSVGMILSMVAYYFFNEPQYTTTIIGLVIIIIPFRLGIVYIGGIYFGKDEIKMANSFEWSLNFLNLVFAIFLVWYLKMGLLGAALSFSLASVLVGIYAIYTVAKRFRIKINLRSNIVKNLVRLGIVYAFTFFVIQLNYRIDILLLEKLSTINEVGIYSLGVHIAEQLWQIPFAIGIVLFSRTANLKDQNKLVSSSVTLARQSVVLILSFSVIIILLAPFLIPLVFGKGFSNSAVILNYILPGIVVMVVYRVLNGYLAGKGKPQYAIYAFAPALILNILLNLILIPEYGAVGAGIASDISYLTGTIIYWILFVNITNVRYYEILNFKMKDISIFADSLRSLRKK